VYQKYDMKRPSKNWQFRIGAINKTRKASPRLRDLQMEHPMHPPTAKKTRSCLHFEKMGLMAGNHKVLLGTIWNLGVHLACPFCCKTMQCFSCLFRATNLPIAHKKSLLLKNKPPPCVAPAL